MPKKLTKYIFFLMTLILVVIFAEIAKSPADDNIRLFFFDVGQGDSSLIQRGSFQILIDGGPDDSILSEVAKAMPLTDRKIDIIILSHPHADHLVGINLLLDRYEVGKIYFSGVVHTSNQYLEFLAKIKDKKVEAIVPDIGESIEPFADSKLTFLWPGKKFQGQTSCSANSSDENQKFESDIASCVENLNNTSEVLKMCSGDNCAIFLGDIETDGQYQMFSTNSTADYQAEILKISHHGSSNGTDETTLLKVDPSYALVSVGAENKYGHPHAAVIDMLEKAGVKTFRTDHDNTVRFSISPAALTPLAP